jgi:hypothetical protein
MDIYFFSLFYEENEALNHHDHVCLYVYICPLL